MADAESMTIMVPSDLAALVKAVVETGDYTSTSEVVHAALRDWETKRASQLEDFAALKAEIDAVLADAASGRIKGFDAARIVDLGRKQLADRSRPA